MQVKELKPSAVDVGEGGVEDRAHIISHADIMETSFAGSTSMLEEFLLLETLIPTFTEYFLPNQMLF